MKDWYIPLTELTNGQVAELFYLANLAGLDIHSARGDGETNIGACNGHFSLWLEKDGKQTTYKKAVKKLHKLIDKEIDKEAMGLYHELFGPPIGTIEHARQIAAAGLSSGWESGQESTAKESESKPLTKIKIGGCEFEAYLSYFAGSVEHSAGDDASMITACSGGGGASIDLGGDFSFSGGSGASSDDTLSTKETSGPAQAISELSFTPTKEGAYKIHFSNNLVSVSYEGEG